MAEKTRTETDGGGSNPLAPTTSNDAETQESWPPSGPPESAKCSEGADSLICTCPFPRDLCPDCTEQCRACEEFRAPVLERTAADGAAGNTALERVRAGAAAPAGAGAAQGLCGRMTQLGAGRVAVCRLQPHDISIVHQDDLTATAWREGACSACTAGVPHEQCSEPERPETVGDARAAAPDLDEPIPFVPVPTSDPDAPVMLMPPEMTDRGIPVVDLRLCKCGHFFGSHASADGRRCVCVVGDHFCGCTSFVAETDARKVEPKAWGWECIDCGTCVQGSPFYAPCPECKRITGRIVIKDDVVLTRCDVHEFVHRADRKCPQCEVATPAAPAVSERRHLAAWNAILMEQPTRERRKLVARCQALHLAQLVEVVEVICGNPS